MSHQLYQNENGSYSLKNLDHGEVMHSFIGPEKEASLLYVEQSRLDEKLTSNGPESLVLFDVGLGAGSNALASIQCFLSKPRSGTLVIHSFENDLNGFSLAIENADKLPFFKNLVQACKTLFENKYWKSDDGKIKWSLHEGDFLKCLPDVTNNPTAKPDLIFFDFYSPKVTPTLWGIEIFSKLFESSKPNTALYTYSAATKVRAALLSAGFFVGFGHATGGKSDTTVASRNIRDLERPLDQRWLMRFSRSHDAYPVDLKVEEKNEFVEKIRTSEQFKPTKT